MKKTLMFVFVWLALTAAFGGGAVFASGMFGKETASQSGVADVADVAEVPDSDYLPRLNPSVRRASGSVYALPAGPLSPEAERLPPPVYAIAGIRGEEIRESGPLEAVDIIVNLPEKESFSRGILEGQDVSDWIQNLPPGLEARAHGVKKGARTISIYVSGTPLVTMRERVSVNIPGTYLTGGNPRLFVSPTEQESLESWEKSQTE